MCCRDRRICCLDMEEILSKVMVGPLILLSSVIQDYAFYKLKTTCDIEAKSIFSYNIVLTSLSRI